jgi:hypothetical protein
MQITRAHFLLLTLAYLLAACGAANSPSGPRDLSRKSEIELRFTPGLEQTVQVDSINWNLGLYDFTVPDQVEIDGRFYIAFRNLSDRDLELRYELRFFDEDTFLVDLFRPFGQPLHLAAGQGLETSDEFFLRIPDPLDLRFIATMRLVANITAPP